MKKLKSEQQAFTYVWKRVLNQGKPSKVRVEGCLYRGPGGLRCAVGWLLPDEYYTPDLEGLIPTEAGFPDLGYDPKFLVKLQYCHDDASSDESRFCELFKTKMAHLARSRGLSCPK